MPESKSRYIPALDGLRAFAVLAVIFYHMSLSWAPGGLLGVTVFFVLSGYLITSLLLIEFDNTGKINLPQFWLRRIRRLVPAIIFVVIGTAVLCTIFNHALLTKMRPDVLPSLLFFNNWWQIFHDVSYFDALGAPSPLAHFWSLAIEEQFYFVWPVALFAALKLGVKKTTLRNATLIFALLSAIEMALLFNPSADPSRVYYGTDTRAFSLLIGAGLAFVWPSHLLGAKSGVRLTKRERMVFDGVGVAALIGLFLMVGLSNGFSPFLYRGGLVLCSVLTAVVIAVIVHPASALGRVAGNKVLAWVGTRSYGIYLWHYPLLLLTTPNTVGDTPWWLYPIQLVLIFGIAEFSYRFVENPLRHGALGAFINGIRSGEIELSSWIQRRIIPVVGGAAIVLVAVGGLIFVPPTSALEGADLLKQAEEQQSQTSNIEPAPAEAEKPKYDVLMIGDSVSVRAVPIFDAKFPHGGIDAAVNRQLYLGAQVYNHYKEEKVVGDLVVFALGTNGPATDEQLDELIGSVEPNKQIWLVNTRSPQGWVETTNAALASADARYDNVHLIDWYAASADRDDLFDGDGTHLSEDGAVFYIDLIYSAIADKLPAHPEDAVPPATEPAPQSADEPTPEATA